MLIRDGRLTEEQVMAALARQAQDGARLGTVMVEMELIDVDTLTVYLGIELGIPIATGATLERAKRTAVRLLTPMQARHYRCIPLIVQDRQIITAMDNPHDMEALDQLYRLTGYRIIPRVAPEVRIFYYLERYYGIPRPMRFSSLGDHLVSGFRARPQVDLPAPPLPGLPPLSEAPVPPQGRAISSVHAMATERMVSPFATQEADSANSASSGARVSSAPTRTGPSSSEGEALRSEAARLANDLEADDADLAGQSSPSDWDAERLAAGGDGFDAYDGPSSGSGEEYEPFELDRTLEAMAAASRRGDIVDAIMCYAAGHFDVAALCVVRDNNLAFGWKAIGPALSGDRIESLLMPLEAPSMFQAAIHKDYLFYGAPFPATLHTYLYRVLRCEPPNQAIVAVIAIGNRTVNLLYGHRGDGYVFDEESLTEVRKMCRAASEAYARLIAASKRVITH